MDLPELGLSDEALLLSVGPAPQITGKRDKARVVTATFHHSSGDVIDLVVDGSKGDRETFGTTSNHPFWSVDRQEYVQAGSLKSGERVLTFSGDTKRVVSKLPRPGPEPVYNLEVHAEHVYFVGQDGVLVHNAYDIDAPRVGAGLPNKGSKRYKELLSLERTIRNTNPQHAPNIPQYGRVFGYRGGNARPTARATTAEANWLGARWAGDGATFKYNDDGSLFSITSKNGTSP